MAVRPSKPFGQYALKLRAPGNLGEKIYWSTRSGSAQADRLMGYRYGVAAAGLTAAVWTALHLEGYAIAHENGWMENQQALCLLGAAIMFARVGCEGLRATKLFYISLALFCFTLLLREMELKGESIPAWATWLSTGTPRNLWLAFLWTWLLVTARRDVREMCQVFVSWLHTPAARLMLVAGLFYLVSWPFDKKVFTLARSMNMFLEELADSMAAILVLVSGIATWCHRARVPRRNAPPRAQREIVESVR
jgi:hypothetical protein